jgi:hypothetical protein
MQIELPLPAWNESAQRADDDAHTLTLGQASAPEWAHWQWATDSAPTVRTQVAAVTPLTLTITL